MLKQKLKKLNKNSFFRAPVYVLIGLILIAAPFALPKVGARSIQDQINSLQQENAKYRSIVGSLQEQATSYQDAINKLHAAINALQAQIDANVAEQRRIQAEIKVAEKELQKQKYVLGESIRAMYVQGQISTLEMLASSQDLNEFVDKKVYQGAVQEQIKEALDKVVALKNQLLEQKAQVEELLKEQKTKQNELASARDKQNELLSYNLNQQESYNQKARENQSRINALIEQQRRANFNPDGGYYFLRFPGQAKSFNPNNYPYRNAGFGMSPGPGCVDNDGPDPWGYCYRQCVSYTAWAVKASGRSVPMYYGNAKDWVAAAYARGVSVYRTPQRGDVAISTSGFWGHSMYVESVSGNTFYTSEYNTYLTGKLSYQTRTY